MVDLEKWTTMKVKIFDYPTKDINLAEEDINDFIKDKKVIDIRHGTAGENCSYWITLVILYEEKPIRGGLYG